jgi:hypothetical protein
MMILDQSGLWREEGIVVVKERKGLVGKEIREESPALSESSHANCNLSKSCTKL